MSSKCIDTGCWKICTSIWLTYITVQYSYKFLIKQNTCNNHAPLRPDWTCVNNFDWTHPNEWIFSMMYCTSLLNKKKLIDINLKIDRRRSLEIKSFSVQENEIYIYNRTQSCFYWIPVQFLLDTTLCLCLLIKLFLKKNLKILYIMHTDVFFIGYCWL